MNYSEPWAGGHWIMFVLFMLFVVCFVSLIWYYRHYPEQKALIERAEKQHAALMNGDDRVGIYGQYLPVSLNPEVQNRLCQQCGHHESNYDPETVDDLPYSLDKSDRGLSWTVRFNSTRYFWDGDHYQVSHVCYEPAEPPKRIRPPQPVPYHPDVPGPPPLPNAPARWLGPWS